MKESKRTHRFSVTLSFAPKRSSDRTFFSVTKIGSKRLVVIYPLWAEGKEAERYGFVKGRKSPKHDLYQGTDEYYANEMLCTALCQR